MGRALSIGGLQGEHDLPGTVESKALVGDGGAGDVAAQVLEFLPLMRGAADLGMQAKALLVDTAHGGSSNVEAVSQTRLPQEFYLHGAPKWDVGCEAGPTDQFGDRKREYCWLKLDNPAPGVQIMDDNSYAMKHETIFEVDAEGVKFIKPHKVSACDGAPRRIAVDGKRIDQLSEKDQIEAVLKGSRLVREEQGKWPYCGIAPNGTYLQGVRPGYDRMMQQWRALHSHQ